MKLNRNVEAVVVALFYLACLYLWTLPIQKNSMPYGEVDAVSHFTIADYTAENDRPISTLPYYIDRRYGRDNSFRPGTLWYPPPFHMDLAIAQIIGGERIRPIFILNAIFSSSIVVILYFVIRNMYSFWPAILSSLLVMFSLRDINIYLWGQWPERISYYLTPLIIYCFYRYYTSFRNNEQKPIYLYIMSGLLAANLYMHPVGLFHSIAALCVVSVFLLIKDRGLPFDIKKLGISIVIFLLLASIFPMQTGSVLKMSKSTTNPPFDFFRLFSWYKPIKDPAELGLPASHFSYKEMHGFWTLPFLLAGMLFLLVRRKRKDLFLLGWLVSLYIMLHLDIIGKGRSFRSLSATAHIFYPIMAIGAAYFTNLLIVKLPKGFKAILKYGLISLFIILAVFINGKAAYVQLDGAYPEIARINPNQYEAMEWIKSNVNDKEAEFFQVGAVSQAKSRWEWMIANRVIFFTFRENLTHAIIDYSDAILMGNQEMIQQIRSYEDTLANAMKIYDQNNIKVYKLGEV